MGEPWSGRQGSRQQRPGRPWHTHAHDVAEVTSVSFSPTRFKMSSLMQEYGVWTRNSHASRRRWSSIKSRRLASVSTWGGRSGTDTRSCNRT